MEIQFLPLTAAVLNPEVDAAVAVLTVDNLEANRLAIGHVGADDFGVDVLPREESPEPSERVVYTRKLNAVNGRARQQPVIIRVMSQHVEDPVYVRIPGSDIAVDYNVYDLMMLAYNHVISACADWAPVLEEQFNGEASATMDIAIDYNDALLDWAEGNNIFTV